MKSTILFTVALSFADALAADWPHWLGPDGNGKTPETLPESMVLTNEAWTAEVGIGFSSFAVVDGKVFTLGHRDGNETLWCFSESDGSVLWSDSYEAQLMPRYYEGGPGATPTVHEGRVYLVSKDGQFRVYQVSDGSLLWNHDLPALAKMATLPEWGFAGSPVIFEDKVLVEAGRTFAFDRESGAEIWRSESFRPAYGSGELFEADGQMCLAALKTDGLVILNPESGETLAMEKWRTSFQTNSTTPLTIGPGQLFVSTGYDRGCALFTYSRGNLAKRYENQNMCNHMGNSVQMDGYLYGFDGTAHRGRPVEFACLDATSGEKLWHYEDLKYGTLIAAGEELVVLSEGGELLIGKPSPDKPFAPRIREKVISGRCWTPPVLANGRIYLRNAEGKVRVLFVPHP